MTISPRYPDSSPRFIGVQNDFLVSFLQSKLKTKNATDDGLESTNRPRQVGVCLQCGRKKKAESPSSRTIPPGIINKIDSAFFFGIGTTDFEISKMGGHVLLQKFLCLGCPPSLVASRANYYIEQKICQRRTRKQKPLMVLSNGLEQK
jgi:hypothetical protein